MFTLKCIAVGTSMLPIASAALAQAPQFGQPIAPADIAAWDISIGPDGVGLPPGRGTAIEGEAIYVAKCQACHGEKGTKPSDALAGALGELSKQEHLYERVVLQRPQALEDLERLRSRAARGNGARGLYVRIKIDRGLGRGDTCP